jgi:glycosyltransferase involved in cell wall biosynthesis
VSSSPVALCHDYLLIMRGGERCFAAIADCWPEAPIYTLLYDPRGGIQEAFGARTVQTSYLQRLRVGQRGFRRLLPFFPRAVEHLPVQDHDLVISSSSAFAHGVRLKPGATHISYCHTPFRYAWHEYDDTIAATSPLMRPLVRRILKRIRAWDRDVSTRVSHYVTPSELSRRRVQEFYGRDSVVIPPPVEVDRFSLGEPEDFFLVVTEIVPHKRVGNALEAGRRAGVPIAVVGGGPELKRLSQEYGDSASFLGRISDLELADLYRRARALILPNVEEFGIAAVEAQASGRPVLAADAGGARETVVSGETGVLVPPEDVDSLAEALRETDWDGFQPHRVRAHAERFSTAEFQRRFRGEVARVVASSDGTQPNRVVQREDHLYPQTG